VELITDQGHPCHTNPLPDVKLPAECERPQLRVVFEEDVGAAGTVVGTYWGHLRTLRWVDHTQCYPVFFHTSPLLVPAPYLLPSS
jgi:hypothetical protein